ncbi:MAG: 30S ribosomal protein S20 [Myxococcales bacterium]|nr:30S ribosomal protein S20 [Myxococcales bacterium]
MANHKSAAKRNRQRITRTTRARAFRGRVRTALKNARTAIEQGEEGAATLVLDAQRLLDKAASKKVLPDKRADRLKSRLAQALAKASKAAG